VTPQSNRLHSRLFLWLPPAALAALLFYLSSKPLNLGQISVFGFDKIMHAGYFSIMGFFVMRAAIFDPLGLKAKSAFILAFVLCSAYGAADEFHQSFVPTRSVDPFDAAADAAGALLGAAVYLYFLKTRKGAAKS